MKRIMLLFAFFAIGLPVLLAQTKQITGKVTSSDDGSAIPGVSVVVKGTTLGTITNAEGAFTLKTPTSATTLVLSFVGMRTEEVALTSSTSYDVKMKSDVVGVDEVMVVAYGTAKKSSFSGSASVIKSDDIAKKQSSNVVKALEGQVAGVQISTASGQPGSSTSIRIRGIGSINASSEPLIILDGIPYDGNLNSISQQDVESMTVLKDAVSNSLYGSRGANGVIVITTKKGSSGKSQINFDAKVGVNSRSVPEYSIMEDPKEYYATYWDALRNLYINNGSTATVAAQNASTNMIDKLAYNVTNVANDKIIDPLTGQFNPAAKILYHDNWGDEMFTNGARQEYNFNVRGSKEKTSYYMSLGYLDDQGYIVNSDFKRYSGRLSFDSQIKSWFKTGASLSYVRTQTNSPDVDPTSGVNMFYVSRMMAPIYPIYKYDNTGNRMYEANGRAIYDYGTDPARPMSSMTNPLGTQNLDKNQYENDYFNGNVFGEITFLRDFKATFRAAIDNPNTRQLQYQNGQYGQFVAQNGSSYVTSSKVTAVNLQQLLNYKKEIGDHNIDVLVGHESYKRDYSYLSASKNNFVLPTSFELDNAILNPQASSGTYSYSTEGFFGRADYNFAEKYFGSVSYRRDASSRFHPDYRWGNFWSIGGAWRLNKEDFLSNIEWIDNLKYKISYGAQGNDALSNLYPYMDQYTVSNSAGQIAVNLYYKGNQKIRWEKNYNLNTGFEFSLFKGRLEGTTEYFQRTVKDMLFNRPLPISGGVSSYPDNIGDMRNRGVDIELKGTLIKTQDLKWTLGINATHFKNKILKLPPERRETGIVSGNFKLMEGKSRYEYFTKDYAGVDAATGNALWYMDVTGADGVVTKQTTKTYSLATDYFQGTAIPNLFGGINTALEYKGIDLSLSFTYQLGGKGYDAIYAGLMASGDDGRNWHTDIRKRWTPTNTTTDVPKVMEGEAYANRASSRFFTSESYLGFQNITVGYTFPTPMMKTIGVEKLRIYFVSDNVGLLSKRKGYDPRQSWDGNSGDYNYSPIRTVSGGIQITL